MKNWQKKTLTFLTFYLLLFVFFYVLVRGNYNVGRIWDASHTTCLAVTPELQLTRHNALVCGNPSALFMYTTTQGGTTTLAFVGSGDQPLYVSHVGKGEVTMRPESSDVCQNWIVSGRQLIAADTYETEQPLCLAIQNGFFHNGLPLVAKRCLKTSKSQMWDFELEKNTFSW